MQLQGDGKKVEKSIKKTLDDSIKTRKGKINVSQDEQSDYTFVINNRGKERLLQKTEDLDSVLNSIVDEIKILRESQSCVVLKASTGLGKSTFLIHKLYQRFSNCKIVCSQVTVVNTIALCRYVAKTQPDMNIGGNIGYQTAHSKQIPTTFHSIMYQTSRMTTLRYLIELQKGTLQNPQNLIIVIDEAHTNDVNSQEQLAVIRDLILSKPKDQLPFFIIQSASIDPQEFADYFDLNNYLVAKGSRFPIVKLFTDNFQLKNQNDVQQSAVDLVETIIKSAYFVPKAKDTPISKSMELLKIEQPLSILIFIAKQKQMTDLEKRLNNSNIVKQSRMQIITISAINIERNPTLIEKNDNQTPKIFISTNVIETGYTINNLSFIIDCMKFKQIYRNPISKVEIIRDLPIDQQMQQQRRGRVGRTRPGIYIGLCPSNISNELVVKKELQIQINNIQQTIAQFGLEQFLNLKFMKQVPYEHLMDYLQIQALIGVDNLQNTSYNIIQSMLFSGMYFKEMRQIIVILLAMNQGIRLLDIIVLISGVMHTGRFRPDRTQQVNDYDQILNQIYSGKLMSPEISNQVTQFIGFFKQHNFNIYTGTPLSNSDAMSKFINCVSLAYYVFMFKRVDKDHFVSKQELKIKIDLPDNVKYFVAMNVELEDFYKCKNIAKITEKQWGLVPCK